MGIRIFIAATTAAFIVAACSSAVPSPGDAPTVGSSTTTDPPKDSDPQKEPSQPSEPGAPIDATPATACPSAFTTNKPVAGTNSGFVVAGQSRKFQMLLPPATFTGPRPILFAFHGTSETGQKIINRAKLADFSARGFVVIAPDAVGNGMVWPVWDGMRPPGQENTPANKDVELFDRLLSCTAAHYAIDKTRVFATGHSAGGIFTNRLLRSRSNVLAGGIIGSGVFEMTSGGSNAPLPLDPMTVVVAWGGDNDTYSGSTSSGVSVPAFSFVEQASLASKFYDAQPSIAHARCRGNNLGHAWLPINSWFIDLLLSRPKGSPATLNLAAVPGGSPVTCSTDPYTLAPLPDMTCPSTARAGCMAACQLFADCAVENRTVGPSLAPQLSKIGFTQTSCGGCVQRCQVGATTASDAAALSCFATKQAAAQCGPGIEGASPLYDAINECCYNRSDSTLCVDLCTTLNESDSSKVFFPVCQQIAN